MDTTDSNSSQATANRGYWRAAAYFFLLLLVVGATAGVSMYEQFVAQIHDLQQKVQQTAQLQYVAVLVDDKGEPAMLLTQASGEAFLQLQRLNSVVEGGEDTMQLWAVPDGGPARSLGLLTPRLKTLRLAATDQTLDGVGKLGMSVEAKGGVSAKQGPRLPYLLTGSVIRKAL
jgi:anti-sigma-K factor RskA